MQSEGSISDDGSVSDDSESDNASEGSYSSEEDMEGNLIGATIFFFILHLHLLLNVTFSSSPKHHRSASSSTAHTMLSPFKIAACLVQDAHSPKHGLACAYILADITKSCRRMKKRNVVSSRQDITRGHDSQHAFSKNLLMSVRIYAYIRHVYNINGEDSKLCMHKPDTFNLQLEFTRPPLLLIKCISP